MASIKKTAFGTWRAKVVKVGYQTQTKTFKTKSAADEWTTEVTSAIDKSRSNAVMKSISAIRKPMHVKTTSVTTVDGSDVKSKTMQALDLVLIEGLSQYAAAQKMGVTTAAVSRAFTRRKDKTLCPYCGQVLRKGYSIDKSSKLEIELPKVTSKISTDNSPVKLVGPEYLATLLHKTVATIRADISRRPQSMPPRMMIPDSRKLLWLESEVLSWLDRRRRI